MSADDKQGDPRRDARRRAAGPLPAADRRQAGGLSGRVVCLTLIALAAPALAQEDAAPLRFDDASRYATCMAIARSDPKAAHAEALRWRHDGGGDAALHCVAVALLGLGDYEQAATGLESLARATGAANTGLRADLLGQAGNAWIIAGKPAEAYRAQSAALALKPDDVDLLIDRAITLGGIGRDWEALDDLNRALALEPDRVDALVFRATAWRRLESYELAEDDAARALHVDPSRLDALLERGRIRKARGSQKDARADFLRLIEIAVEGPTRDAARRELESIDVQAP